MYVAFLWHQHQPCYQSYGMVGTGHGHYQLPWVRLHGTRDYGGLIKLWARYPSLHQTVSLTPCLLAQLEDYAQGLAIDRHLALTVSPVEKLSLGQKAEILNTFFEANPYTQIFPQHRYQQLYEQRQRQGIDWCVAHWQPQDFSDLLAWHNLIWFDPLTVAEDKEVWNWYFRQKSFTLGDRQRIISKQRQIIQGIIPLHHQLQESGQLEIITSPYGHPILPLLADTNIARTVQAALALPDPRFCWSEDGIRQLQRGKQYYREIFGRESRGLWPPGLAISPAMLQTVAQLRFEWLCADESVLAKSLSTGAERSAWLNSVYRVPTEDGELAMVFRDQQLSDLISFHYGRYSPAQAAQDLIERLLARRPHPDNGQPRLVTIALEGDGTWNGYENSGFDFLQQFYQQCEQLGRQRLLQLVTVSEFMDQFPPTQVLTQHNGIPSPLVGSWNRGNFSQWIGQPSQNQAWDYLIDARQTLASHPEATEENNPEAWQALYGAESSDWFEAFGQGNSAQTLTSEALFRQHLIRLYHALNEIPPGYLHHPLMDQNGDRHLEGHLYPHWDNLTNLIPWQVAHPVPVHTGQAFVSQIYYGHDRQRLILRFDFHRLLPELIPDELHLAWYYPYVAHGHAPLAIASLPDQGPLNYYFHHHCRINLHHLQSHHEIAVGPNRWQPHPQRPQLVHQGQTLVVVIPLTALPETRPDSLHLLLLLGQQGEFWANLSGDNLVQWRLH
ncbi:Alpha-amylase [Synechocystis sp. PCC 6714]|nr:Alpha-amylase [Synechocystis sp. PCC 6714]